MFDKLEDSRNELKEILNDKLEKEVISFLNSNGGNLYIGIKDDLSVVGIDGDIDKIQLEIKDRIKNNILPTSLGLFDILVEEYNNKKILHISIAGGSEQPYYLKSKGMTSEGCFIRVGNSVEKMSDEQIKNLFSTRTRNSLRNIKSPRQDLSFSQLKIYYEEMGYQINDNFLKQLDLIMEDGKYNYVAYLLSDTNSISIKVATYSGNDAYDLIENEEYGYCSLIKATKRVIDKFELINKTFSKITGDAERKELKMFDRTAVREAIVNAIVHNLWQTENPPKFEIFNDHISITSTGGLPQGVTKDEFLKGYSFPKNPELMRVFKDLDLVEQLGTGIIRILKSYDESVYEFTSNFIRVNFNFNDYNMLLDSLTNNYNKLNETQQMILSLIKENKEITQNEMIDKLGVGRTTITNNLKKLKENGYIDRVGSNKTGSWRILK